MSEMLLTAYDGAILGPIAKLLGWVMNGVYYLMDQIGIGNVGLSIIIFTIIIYLLLFPLTYKQQKFSKLSQKMQPELNAINKKYQGKKDQASMMARPTGTVKHITSENNGIIRFIIFICCAIASLWSLPLAVACGINLMFNTCVR